MAVDRADPAGKRLAFLAVHVENCYLATGFGQLFSGGSSQTFRTTRDNRADVIP
jgi:hypothetical protein